ncbi:hypothetical protein FRB99_001302 [Tulasnella sp. 403]|nr:hypothetical protein FRB99_001302 [Tulasnella sp. 403]
MYPEVVGCKLPYGSAGEAFKELNFSLDARSLCIPSSPPPLPESPHIALHHELLIQNIAAMPLVQLATSDISLFYRSNFSKFNPSKSTILLLHGLLSSTDFLSPQFEDESLAGKYNMIAFDQLSCGQTINNVSGRKDAHVEAAAIMLALETLGLKDVSFHVFAVQGISQQIALRLAKLWPDRVRSLFFCSVGGPEEYMQWFRDVTQMWGDATSQGELDDAVAQFLSYLFGEDERTCTVEEKDELVAYWLTNFPPNKRSRLYDIGNALGLNYLSDEELKTVSQPVLIAHGDAHPVYPVSIAEDFCSKLAGARRGAKLEVIAGGAAALQYPKYFAQTVDSLYADFLSSLEADEPPTPLTATIQPRSRSGTLSVEMLTSEEERDFLLPALQKLKGSSVTAIKDGAWCFSVVDDAKREELEKTLRGVAQGQENAYSPELDGTGHPVAKYVISFYQLSAPLIKLVRRWSERGLESLFETHETKTGKTNAGQGNAPVPLRRPSIDLLKSVEIEHRTSLDGGARS